MGGEGDSGIFQSDPNYPLIFLFAGIGCLSALLTALGWPGDRRGWRAFSSFFTLTMFAQAAYELSFAFVPVREWIRVDLLLTLPYAATGLTVLLGRTLWRWAVRRLARG